MKKKILITLADVLSLALAVFFSVVPAQVEKSRNKILKPPPYRASERAAGLHKRLIIADLHADSLL